MKREIELIAQMDTKGLEFDTTSYENKIIQRRLLSDEEEDGFDNSLTNFAQENDTDGSLGSKKEIIGPRKLTIKEEINIY